jgi:hypothetical protein
LYGWKDFCEFVKHRNRYMFHLRPRRPAKAESAGPRQLQKPAESTITTGNTTASPQAVSSESDVPVDLNPFNLAPESMAEIMGTDLDDMIDERLDGVSASRMLEAIGGSADEVGLVKKMPARTRLFRARVGPSGKPYRTARKLGPPPERKAIASRMSPAGIPMFYGAGDEYCAIAETVVGRLPKGKIINVGVFETIEDIQILDLTNVPAVPSLFSPTRHLRPILRFLRSFVKDLSKPIKKDDHVHTEYIPTQIVTEYFRHSFHLDSGPAIRGILYPSARAKGRTACVLFFTREGCGAPDTSQFAEEKKQWLRFVPKSAKVFRRKPRKPKKSPTPILPVELPPSPTGQLTLDL